MRLSHALGEAVALSTIVTSAEVNNKFHKRLSGRWSCRRRQRCNLGKHQRDAALKALRCPQQSDLQISKAGEAWMIPSLPPSLPLPCLCTVSVFVGFFSASLFCKHVLAVAKSPSSCKWLRGPGNRILSCSLASCSGSWRRPTISSIVLVLPAIAIMSWPHKQATTSKFASGAIYLSRSRRLHCLELSRCKRVEISDADHVCELSSGRRLNGRHRESQRGCPTNHRQRGLRHSGCLLFCSLQ